MFLKSRTVALLVALSMLFVTACNPGSLTKGAKVGGAVGGAGGGAYCSAHC